MHVPFARLKRSRRRCGESRHLPMRGHLKLRRIPVPVVASVMHASVQLPDSYRVETPVSSEG